MKITKEFQEDHQVALTVVVDNDTFESEKQKAAKRIAKGQKIAGFRPGKAPYHIILRHLGEGPILNEAIDNLIENRYATMIEESEIEPYGSGTLKEISSHDPLTLEFVVPLAPEVELGDYKTVRQEYELPEVTEEDRDNEIQQLLSRQASIEAVDRPAALGDIVYLSVTGNEINITKSEDDEAGSDVEVEPVINEPYYPLVLEELTEGQLGWVYPDFYKLFIGLEKDAEVEASYTYPEDFHKEDLANKTLEFSVQLFEIKSRVLPELNDEFAQSLGDYESVEELNEKLMESLVAYKNDQYDNEYRQSVLESIGEISTIKYPPQLVEAEMDNIIGQIRSNLQGQKLDLETFLKIQNIDFQTFRENYRDEAVMRIKNSLTLLEIAKAEDLEIDDKEIVSETTNFFAMVTESYSKKEKRRMVENGVLERMIVDNVASALEKKALEFILTSAKGELPAVDEGKGEETEETEEQPELQVEDIEAVAETALPEEEEITESVNENEE